MSAREALVLAGRRGGHDALAAAHGVSHRALVPVGGVPMLLRVVRALRALPGLGAVHVSIETPEVLEPYPELVNQDPPLVVHEAEDSPSRSALAVLASAPDTPFLVTTADHALLSAAMLAHFAEAADASGADLAVGFVGATLLQGAYPEARRTWLRLRGEAWSGANLFAFRTPRSREAARFWVRAERFRKQPWRLVAAIGPGLLARYAVGRLDLDAALDHASRRIGVRVRAVSMPMPEAAIDVDGESDLELATRVLATREARAREA